jgi:hypothetical protein
MPSISDTQLRIKQTLDIDAEISFIPWELNIQYFAATTARVLHARGLLRLGLTQIQRNTHALNISIVNGHIVIADRFVPGIPRLLGSERRHDGIANYCDPY